MTTPLLTISSSHGEETRFGESIIGLMARHTCTKSDKCLFPRNRLHDIDARNWVCCVVDIGYTGCRRHKGACNSNTFKIPDHKAQSTWSIRSRRDQHYELWKIDARARPSQEINSTVHNS